MHGNIYSPLNLSHGNTRLRAEGWIEFEGDEQEATLTVKFTQNGAWGTRSETYTRDPNEPRIDWEIDVTAANNGAFQKTIAHGRADADVTTPANSLDAGWDKDVELH
jgi:hypothetical protein